MDDHDLAEDETCCPRDPAFPADTDTCGAFTDEFICTRPEGHAGPHTACHVAQHRVHTWTEETR
jgi:hypothetical protein